MKSRTLQPRRRALVLATSLLLLGAGPAAAQSVTVRAGNGADSTWIVDRVSPAAAPGSLTTRDRLVSVVLLDTTLVLQFTDAGLDHLQRAMRDSAPPGLGHRVLAQMIGAALGSMFDHGIAYPLSSLRLARVDGSRLILEGRDGRRVFENVEIDGRDVMNDFAPADAARFVALVNRRIGR